METSELFREPEVILKLLKSLPLATIFVSAVALLWIMAHLCIPFLTEVTGWEPIIFWFVCGGLGVFIPLIITDVIMLRKEGYKFTKETFVERLRFRPMSRRDWNYSLTALVVIGLLTGGIMVVMQAFVPNYNHTPSFMTLEPLSSGRYWQLLVILLPLHWRLCIEDRWAKGRAWLQYITQTSAAGICTRCFNFTDRYVFS